MNFSVYDFFDRILPATPGYVRRDAQLEMAENVERALYERKKICCEAEVGTGKSYAYLVPGILYARERHKPLLISTGTINLQEQLGRRDIEKVNNILMEHNMISKPLRVQILKGNANYFCPRQARNVIRKETMKWVSEKITQSIEDNQIWPILEIGLKDRLYKGNDIARLLFYPLRSGVLSDSLTELFAIGLNEGVYSQNVLLDMVPNYSSNMSQFTIVSNLIVRLSGEDMALQRLRMLLTAGLDNERFYQCIQDMIRNCFHLHKLVPNEVAAMVGIVNEQLSESRFAISKTADSIWNLLMLYSKFKRIDRSDFDVDQNIWDKVSAQKCRTANCKERGCLFRSFKYRRDQGDSCDIQICNHNFLMAYSQNHSFSMSRYAALIIDEAHNIDTAAHAIFGIECLQTNLENVAERVYGFLKGKHLGRHVVHKNYVMALQNLFIQI